MDCVRDQTRLLWLSIGTFTCLKESRTQREAFLRVDTSLLRAACWTTASGMRLASHVKVQCGETRKLGWCCEILLEAGARLSVKKSLEVSSVVEQATRSWTSDVSFLEPPAVQFYVLIHSDRMETRCRFIAVWTLSGGCWCISLADLYS